MNTKDSNDVFKPVPLKRLVKANIRGDVREMTFEDYQGYEKSDYHKGKVSFVEDLGEIGIEGLEIRTIKEYSGRCYYAITQELKSPKELSKDDLALVRRQYPFLHGQKHAENEGVTEIDGFFIYKLVSECDSGD